MHRIETQRVTLARFVSVRKLTAWTTNLASAATGNLDAQPRECTTRTPGNNPPVNQRSTAALSGATLLKLSVSEQTCLHIPDAVDPFGG